MGIDRGILMAMKDLNKSGEPKLGVGKAYKDGARTHCDLLFKVTIKGESKLAEEIPLHMSLKIFNNMNEFTREELDEAIKKFDISAPDTSVAEFEPIIFHSEKSDADYYMLKIHNVGDKYSKFYRSFGEKGVTYDKFFLHITINEELYNKIKEEGLKPDEIEFSELTLENGANNTAHVFKKSEDLEKGLKHAAVAMGVAGSLIGTGNMGTQRPATAPKPQTPKEASMYSHKRMLNAIAQVESSGGKMQQHKPTTQGTAYGKYALMPDTIKETIHMNPDLRAKYAKGMSLKGQDLQNYMQDNPGLEDAIADRHLQRLEHHFGQNPDKVGFAWNQGIHGTYRAKPDAVNQHQYTRKIKDAWSKVK